MTESPTEYKAVKCSLCLKEVPAEFNAEIGFAHPLCALRAMIGMDGIPCWKHENCTFMADPGCVAFTVKGERCKLVAKRGSEYCVSHKGVRLSDARVWGHTSSFYHISTLPEAMSEEEALPVVKALQAYQEEVEGL